MIDAAIVYVSPDTVGSGAFLLAELPAIAARRQREASFPIIPVFDAIRPTKVAKITRDVGLPLPTLGPIELPASDRGGRHERIATLAQGLASTILDRYLGRVNSGQAFGIDMFSRRAITYDYPAVIRLDWTDALDPTPPPASWEDELLPALRDLRDVLGRHALRPIALRPAGSHLSFGLAFGFVFSDTSGFLLWVEQWSGGQAEWWRTDQPPAADPPLEIVPPENVPSSDLRSGGAGHHRRDQYHPACRRQRDGLDASQRHADRCPRPVTSEGRPGE
jgi:hypothetical protein